MDIFFNCSGQDFVKGANGSRIVKEFLKKSKAIWFHRSKFFEISNYNSEFYHGNRPIDLAQTPVLYTVGQQATFWNMNSSVWAVRAVKKKSGFEVF